MLFTSTGRYHPARTICASPNASLESVLLICIESAAFACRAWMHTIGMPAAFSACQCQTASGPVSIATFTARGAFVRTTSAIASGVERHVPCQTRLPSPSITQIAVSFWETSKPTYCSIANPPGGENLQVITACDSPPSLAAAAPQKYVDNHNAADVPVRSAESRIALPSPPPPAMAPAITGRSLPGSPEPVDTGARCSSHLATASLPGFARRCLLARLAARLASSLDFLQGTSEKIYLQRFLRQNSFQMIHFFAPCRYARFLLSWFPYLRFPGIQFLPPPVQLPP